MPTTALRTPADIIGAAAGLLGFAPTNSIVAYMLRHDPNDDLLIVRAALRFDVTITTEQATRFPPTCNLRAADNDAAVLLAVCDQPHDRHAAAILDALRDALDTAGIPVIRRIMTHNVTDEGQWYNPDSGQYGPTYPYTDSLITAQRILAGDRVSRGRSDIEAEFAPITPAPPVAIGDHGQLVITTAEEISDALNGHPINRTLPTRAGIIITADVAVRDAMLTAALEHTQAAAELWTHIARRLRGQPRAEALTIAAVAYCLLGDGIRAGIAAETALEDTEATHSPTPRLAALLLTALRTGIAPHEIRRVIPGSTLKPSQD
jgi:Domain of unknown function (DUF4192)